MFVVWVVAAILTAMGVVYIFLWFVGEAQTTGLVHETLNLWAMSHCIYFILNLVLWEIIYVGIPVIIVIAIIYLGWWKKLPAKERKEYKDGNLFGGRSRRSDAGGAFSFFVTIAFIIKIIMDGNWDKPFADWTFDYLVGSWITALIWILIIAGIPMLLYGAWWISQKVKN